jgi:hypothetical protein
LAWRVECSGAALKVQPKPVYKREAFWRLSAVELSSVDAGLRLLLEI